MRLIVKDYKQLKFKENLLWIGTVSLVTVLLWIGYTVYRSYSDTTVEKPTQAMLEPLNPSIDKEALGFLEDRHYPPTEFEPLVISEDETFTFAAPPPSTASPSADFPPPPPPSPEEPAN